MWELYDRLLAGIPEDVIAEEVLGGLSFAAVRTPEGDVGLGSCHWQREYTRPATHPGNLNGLPLREVAALIKSWNPPEAAIGQAAINAWYNTPARAKANGVSFGDGREDRMNDPFIMSQREIRGKKVVTIGHFPYLEKLFEPICELSILEYAPDHPGDYPMEAADYLLPECDFAYLNANGLVDHSLPRMLSLSQNAKITLVGPCAPLWPGFADYRVQEVSGFVVTDPEKAWRIAAGSERVRVFSCGKKVAMKWKVE